MLDATGRTWVGSAAKAFSVVTAGVLCAGTDFAIEVAIEVEDGADAGAAEALGSSRVGGAIVRAGTTCGSAAGGTGTERTCGDTLPATRTSSGHRIDEIGTGIVSAKGSAGTPEPVGATEKPTVPRRESTGASAAMLPV